MFNNESFILRHLRYRRYAKSPRNHNDSNFKRFCQTPKKRKIILIDDVDRINNKDLQRFIEAISSEFEYIIFASKDKLELDLLDRMKAYLNTADTIYAYKIAQFYSDKRRELVEKTVNMHIDDLDSRTRISLWTSTNI